MLLGFGPFWKTHTVDCCLLSSNSVTICAMRAHQKYGIHLFTNNQMKCNRLYAAHVAYSTCKLLYFLISVRSKIMLVDEMSVPGSCWMVIDLVAKLPQQSYQQSTFILYFDELKRKRTSINRKRKIYCRSVDFSYKMGRGQWSNKILRLLV